MNTQCLKNNIIENYFLCPVCHACMYVQEDGRSAYCRGERKHCFDFSKDGYLAMSHSAKGDLKVAVEARKSFFQKGYYEPIAHYICDTIKNNTQKKPNLLVDAGCGEGYYTNQMSMLFSHVLGFDLSKFGCIAGAKSAKKEGMQNVLYSTASVFELPIKDESADCITNVFAPCAELEYNRILKKDGILVLVSAGKNHLMGLKEILYNEVYQNQTRADLPQNMQLEKTEIFSYEIEVAGREDIENLFSMTPYYWRTSQEDKAKLSTLDTLKTTVEFEIFVYKKIH